MFISHDNTAGNSKLAENPRDDKAQQRNDSTDDDKPDEQLLDKPEEAINIFLWAIVAIAVIYFVFMLIGCLGGMPSFPHR